MGTRAGRVAAVLAVSWLLVACGPTDDGEPGDGGPDGGGDATGSDGMTFEEYCAMAHVVEDVTAEPVDGGVEVRWYRYPEPMEPTTFVVYRREVGQEEWQRVAEVVRDDVADLGHVDEEGPPDVAHEYAVTVVDEGCGGESEICDEPSCVFPTAVPGKP